MYRLPANTPAFAAHKGTTVEEVYAPGKWNSHLSDFVAAFAIMHDGATRQAPPGAGEAVPRSAYVSRSQREGTYGLGGPGASRGRGDADGRGGAEPVFHHLTACSRSRAPGRHGVPLNVIPQHSPDDTLKRWPTCLHTQSARCSFDVRASTCHGSGLVRGVIVVARGTKWTGHSGRWPSSAPWQ